MAGRLSNDETFNNHMDALTKYMPMALVLNGLRAAINPETEHILDALDKVEMRVDTKPESLSAILVLRVWWKLSDEDYHVAERSLPLEMSQMQDPVKLLVELTRFEPEDVLKYAAFI
jgi:hypothetical protein